MPYVTGTASNMTALLTALRNACTANGWTLSGNVLHKGTCYAEVRLGNNGETGAPLNTMLYVKAGNGIDGSNNLTDAPNRFAMIGPLRAADGSANWPDWDWPVSYHIHIHTSPDEVYLMVNYGGGQFWQAIMFGQSPAPGNAGTGNWHHGHVGEFFSDGVYSRQVNGCGIMPDGSRPGASSNTGFPSGTARWTPAPFWWAQNNLNFSVDEVKLGARIHGAIDSTTGNPIWSNENSPYEGPISGEGSVSAAVTARPLLAYGPNTWNNETHLVPIQIAQKRPSSKTSLIGELEHIRMCRNDFIDPASVVTLGTDKWKVYPCYRKDATAANRNGGGRIDHSGTIAMAIRYDGP